ncbi:MAG: hypothetical protein ACI4D4_02460 [Lachnospira sp.]
MKKTEKGNYGYLGYKKKLNLIMTIAAFAVVLTVLVLGIIIFKSKTNYMTVLSVVLVLPAAKIAVSYFVLIPHKICPKELHEAVENNKGSLLSVYDVVVSNSKSPIGICAMVISDSNIAALTLDNKADKKMFETSLKEFMKNDKLNVNVTLYNDESTFLKRVKNMSENFNSEDTDKVNRAGYNKDSCLNMCL